MATDTKQRSLLPITRGWSVTRTARPVLLPFLELQIPMVLGALVCYLVTHLIPASSSFVSAYHPGTYLYAAGDILFLSVPVVAWTVVRGRGWRHGLEMAGAMIAPVAAIIVVGQLAGSDYLPLLVFTDYPAMCLGLVIYLLYCQRELASWAQEHAMDRFDI